MTTRLPTAGRLLGLIVVLLVLAAAALWGASQGTWVARVVDNPLSGRRTVVADGARVEPILVPWALLGLAAVGGLVATAVWGRRVVGILVAVAGGWAVLRAVLGLVAPRADAVGVGSRPGDRTLPVEIGLAGPVLALAGGLLMLAAGLLTARAAAELPRLGARYDAPGTDRPRPTDPDRALWEAQDEGADPTVAVADPPARPPTAPGGPERSAG